MTKTYIGNDQYEVHLDSGKQLTLSGEEIKELSEDKISRADYMVQVQAIKDIDEVADDFIDAFRSLMDNVKYNFDTMSKDNTLSELQELRTIFQDISNETSAAKVQTINTL